jgi:phage tail sheath protein FI
MAFQLSAGVNVSEIDLTNIVPGVSTSIGAFVGNFNWGPANTVITVSSETDLVNKFGKPDSNTFTSFFTAANFLSYANNLKLVRAANGSMKNAGTAIGNTTGNNIVTISIPNQDYYNANYLTLAAAPTGNSLNILLGQTSMTNLNYFVAKYPGDLGNSLRVSLCANTYGFTGNTTNLAQQAAWAYATQFPSAPSNSVFGLANRAINDEMHIIIIDEDGRISGTANTVLERWGYVSKAFDAKSEDGSSNYYVNVLNDRSKYVYAVNHIANSNWGLTVTSNTGTTNFNAGDASTYEASLTNGTYLTATDAEITGAYYQNFRSADDIDISLIITGAHSATVVQNVIDNIAENRKDCVVFFSPPSANVVNKGGSEETGVTAWKTNTVARSSSYAFMDCNWKYQFDKYNNVYRWVPLNGDIAGLCARTDEQRDPWYSPAGYNRGQIKNVVKLAWNPNKTQRDTLYAVGVNPVVTFAGDGTVLFGDKTLLAKPSAFDRINVRRLFIVLEKAIARASKYSLFEFNDEFTRAQFVSLVEPFLRDVQGRRGIFDFRVICDTTNNTPEVIDRNEFVGDIYIKPARSINFIQLNFVAVRTGVAFEEIVGRF